MEQQERLFQREQQLERLMQLEKREEDQIEYKLRPETFEEYAGQENIKANLKVFIEASKHRAEALDHVLLYGPPGLGKTTLASIIAKTLGVHFKITSGPALEKAGDLAAVLTQLEARDVLFIDEIHRLPRPVEEILYPAMEDGVLDIMIGKGPSARSVRLDLAPFTLIGATTKAGNLSSPLRDRFGIINRLELYKEEELFKILQRDAEILGVSMKKEALLCLAKASRGTPRIAIRLLKRVRDFAQVEKKTWVDQALCEKALAALGIDAYGLDEVDRNLLLKMIEFYQGGPVGLETLSAISGEDKQTLEDMIEPFLMANGFLMKTPRGRKVSEKAYQHLGKIQFFKKEEDVCK